MNIGNINNIIGDFIGNYAYTNANSTNKTAGGAIENRATIGNIYGDFVKTMQNQIMVPL